MASSGDVDGVEENKVFENDVNNTVDASSTDLG